LYAGKASKAVLSHVFLDGGKASIKEDKLDDFFNVYEKAITNPFEKPCIVERTGSVFKMFMDVDLKDFKGDLEDTAKQIMSMLPKKLELGHAIVCRKMDRCLKEGLHIVWEDLVVTSEVALNLVRELQKNLTEYNGLDWASALDLSVYKNNGLRMLYSSKNKTDLNFYVPWFTYTSSGTEYVKNPFVDIGQWLRRCTVQARAGDSPPSLTPTQTQTQTQTLTPTPSQTPFLTPFQTPSQTPIQNSKSTKREKDKNDRDIQAAMDVILENTPYLGCAFTKTDDKNIITLSSRFCLNVQRDHRSNGVYLIVSRDAVHQACYCKCPNTNCENSRTKIAGKGNALSILLYPCKKRKASVLPQNSMDMQMRWHTSFVKQRGP
jgi:hypothetical protein